MSYGNHSKVAPFSETYTTERYNVGTIRVEDAQDVIDNGSGVSTTTTYSLLAGPRVWVFILAGSAIAAGDLVNRSSTSTPFTGVPEPADSVARVMLLGVADNAIASGSYGWVIARGCCVVSVGASGTAGSAFQSDGATTAAGDVSDCINDADDDAIGMFLEAEDATTTAFAQAYINVL